MTRSLTHPSKLKKDYRQDAQHTNPAEVAKSQRNKQLELSTSCSICIACRVQVQEQPEAKHTSELIVVKLGSVPGCMGNNGLLLCSVCWWVFQQGELLLETTDVLSHQGCQALPCRRAEPCQGAQGLSCSRHHLSHPVISKLHTATHSDSNNSWMS